MPDHCDIQYIRKGCVQDAEVNALWRDAYPDHVDGEIVALLARCATYWVARVEGTLVGCVRAVGDGNQHAFLLDPIVRSDWRRRGIGKGLISRLAADLSALNYDYIHVDYTKENDAFYRAVGFKLTLAGLMKL